MSQKLKLLCPPEQFTAKVTNLRVADFAEGSPFAGKGYAADEWKAYVEFDICHTLPEVWLGPVGPGDYIGFFGDTLAKSHTSLRHQQFNYRHLLKAYASEKAGKKDHIIGCIVDTAMDHKPVQGWYSPKNTGGAQCCIHCAAVVFKLADGVDDILGAHLASREKQGVSIEVITDMGNLGVYRPSTNEIHSILDVPETWLGALTKVDGFVRPKIGTLEGEQLIVVYGADGRAVSFQGVGMTPNPAEKFAGTEKAAANLTSVLAEERCAVAAEEVPRILEGLPVKFSTGRSGRIERVLTQGKHGPHAATIHKPLCEVKLSDGSVYLPMAEALQKIA